MAYSADPVEGVLFVQPAQEIPGKGGSCDQEKGREKVQSAELNVEIIRFQPLIQPERNDDHRQEGFSTFDQCDEVDGKKAGEGERQVGLAADREGCNPAATL